MPIGEELGACIERELPRGTLRATGPSSKRGTKERAAERERASEHKGEGPESQEPHLRILTLPGAPTVAGSVR